LSLYDGTPLFEAKPYSSPIGDDVLGSSSSFSLPTWQSSEMTMESERETERKKERKKDREGEREREKDRKKFQRMRLYMLMSY
jgi:hypothetical protein